MNVGYLKCYYNQQLQDGAHPMASQPQFLLASQCQPRLSPALSLVAMTLRLELSVPMWSELRSSQFNFLEILWLLAIFEVMTVITDSSNRSVSLELVRTSSLVLISRAVPQRFVNSFQTCCPICQLILR